MRQAADIACPAALAAVEACEQRLVNLWPAIDTLLVDGWVARFANGYSGRANALSPLQRGAALDAALLAHVVRLYRQAGLPPAIRVTPLAHPGTGDWLTAEGWQVSSRSLGMIASLDGADVAADPAVSLEAAPHADWLDGVSRLQEPRKSNAAHLAAIVGRIRLPAMFATLEIEGVPAGFGMMAVDRGMAEIGSIILQPGFRGKGLGRRLVIALLSAARDAGAGSAFLQVEMSNTPARSLYRSVGFADLYTYTEMRLPAGHGEPVLLLT